MGFGCYDAYKEYDSIWFSAIDHNGLYKMNLNNNELIRLAEFPNEDNIFELHRRIIFHNRLLFFIPYKGKGISAYHLDTGKMDYYIPDGKEIHASDAFLDGEIIWIIPRNLNQPLYEFNVEQGTFYKHEEWNSNILKIPGINENNILSLTSTCFFNKTMTTVLYNTPYVIKTDIRAINDMEIYCLSDEYPLRGIAYDDGSYWMTLARGGSVLHVDFINKDIKVIDLDTCDRTIFMNLIVDNDAIIVLPCKDSYIYKFYKNGNSSYKYITDNKPNMAKMDLPLYMGWIKDGNDLFLLPSAGDSIEKYNSENEYKADFNISEVICKSNIFYETDDRSLSDFVDIVKYYKNLIRFDEIKNTYGRLIWESTKDL